MDWRDQLRLGSFRNLNLSWKEKKDFLMNKESETLKGVWCFVSSDCHTCKMLIEEFKKNGLNLDTINFVDCLEDPMYFLTVENIDDLPQTRVYKDNNIVWSKNGVLFSTQIKKMLEACK